MLLEIVLHIAFTEVLGLPISNFEIQISEQIKFDADKFGVVIIADMLFND